MPTTSFNVGDVVWTQTENQWIRVVIDFVYLPDRLVAVHALFPGDAHVKVWSVPCDNIRTEQPLFDELDSVDDGGGYEFA